MSFETIRVEREGPLAIITIAREKALNALNSHVLTELLVAVAGLRGVIVRSNHHLILCLQFFGAQKSPGAWLRHEKVYVVCG